MKSMGWPLLAVLLALPRAADADEKGKVDYLKHVRPILARHCLNCHGRDAEHREAGLRLDTREGATGELESGSTAVVPGNTEESELVFRITEEDDSVRMPPPKTGDRLEEEEIAVLQRWVEEGAEYREHWAFVPPNAGEVPARVEGGHAETAIDRFVERRLVEAGLRLAEEADRYVLARRLSLDLRGLPATPEEGRRFVEDERPGAYERLVDRLLADPAFGERWSRPWLDLARYADSAGYGSDPLRPNMWRYRDWLIGALNTNLPYDTFVVDQVAGDLKPGATLEQRMATAFHRNTMTNTEGGTDDEEFRTAAIKDRVDTTGQVFLGLTLGCAKCHTHKYDPISHEDYYRFYAFFNQTADNDQPDERPLMDAPTAWHLAEQARVDAKLAALRARLEEPSKELETAQAVWEAGLSNPESWTVLVPEGATSAEGTQFEIQGDGTVRAVGPRPERDVYTITAALTEAKVTAIRLETLPEASLPAGGAGRADDGNFVLSRVGAAVVPKMAPAVPLGRVVKISLSGEARMLSLAEVQVFAGGMNVAVSGAARQSSTDYEGEAARAIDGNTNGHYFEANSTTHTRNEANPWWELRLAEPTAIERIVVWNRTDGSVGERLGGARVQVLDEAGATVWEAELIEAPNPSRELTPSGHGAWKLRAAWADYSQAKFGAAEVLRAKASGETGWAVGPKLAEAHTLVLVPEPRDGLSAGDRLTLTLEHQYKDAGFLLGRFRISVSANPGAAERVAVPADILAIVDTPVSSRTEEQRSMLARHYRSIAPELQGLRDEIAAVEKSRPAMPTLPVMEELTAEKRRVTKLLNKGNFLDPAQVVEPGVPAAFPSMPDEAPANRLGLAHWLVKNENPLTARVAANRAWAQLFGKGIVETEEDFGTQGELPSHPELLDWLAVRYRESGWDTKGLIRAIVMSRTYRQSSRVSPELLGKDPRNVLLSRGPRMRLEAEMVRDQALALAGLLSQKVGGPSVYPPQPDGLWQAAFNGERTWTTSVGEDRYRRGLYTFWRRTVPYPSMTTFDAPSREICTVKRVNTNTPLQAFVTMNDPVFVEAAQGLARRIAREGGASPAERARWALELCTGRPAEDRQVTLLVELFESELQRYQADAAAATALATEPLGPLPEGMDAAELAAWTSVANVLLNLDAVLMKG